MSGKIVDFRNILSRNKSSPILFQIRKLILHQTVDDDLG